MTASSQILPATKLSFDTEQCMQGLFPENEWKQTEGICFCITSKETADRIVRDLSSIYIPSKAEVSGDQVRINVADKDINAYLAFMLRIFFSMYIESIQKMLETSNKSFNDILTESSKGSTRTLKPQNVPAFKFYSSVHHVEEAGPEVPKKNQLGFPGISVTLPLKSDFFKSSLIMDCKNEKEKGKWIYGELRAQGQKYFEKGGKYFIVKSFLDLSKIMQRGVDCFDNPEAIKEMKNYLEQVQLFSPPVAKTATDYLTSIFPEFEELCLQNKMKFDDDVFEFKLGDIVNVLELIEEHQKNSKLSHG